MRALPTSSADGAKGEMEKIDGAVEAGRISGHRWARRAFLTLCVVVGASFLIDGAAEAVPANPAPTTLEQPDGATFRARLWGDEFSHGYETKRGYTVVQNSDDVWVYAERTSDGDLRATKSRPDEDPPPAGVERHERPDAERPAGAPGDGSTTGVPSAGPPGGAHTGTEKLMVIFAEFSNQTAVSTNAAYWNNQFFGASGSVKDFYSKASFGSLTIAPAEEPQGTANDGVVTVTLPYVHPNPAGAFTNVQGIARDAIVAADSAGGVNFAAFDTNNNGVVSGREMHLIVVLAGYETAYGTPCGPSVWGHNWSIGAPPTVDGKLVGGGTDGSYSMFGEQHCSVGDPNNGHAATIGIMAHELGHDLGWPDLYDTNGGSAGIGSWSIMAGGSWLATTGYLGSLPALPDAFSKYYQGWITPTALTGANNDVSIAQSATNASAIRMLNNPNGVDWSFGVTSGAGEYFLIENRQQAGLDAALPGCGLLVYHIDETRSAGNDANANENRKLVDVEEADGLAQLDNESSGGDPGDPFPGSSNKLDFNGTTNPNSNLYSNTASNVNMHVDSTSCASTMSADFTDVAPPPAGRALSVNDVSVNEGGVATFTISASGTGPTVTVNVTTSNGSAAAPGDYVATTQAVTVDSHFPTQTFTIQTNQDSVDEPNETFFVNLSGQTAGTIADAQGIGTIVDDDVATLRAISVNDVTVNEGGQASFTITATNPGAAASVNVATSNGSAVAPGDYTAVGTTSVSIPANSTSVPVTVQTVQDTTDEPNETFFVNLSAPSANATIADSQGTGTIVDDDDPPPATRSITVNDVTVSEGDVATFTITATNPGTQATVNIATSNGSATAPGDYTAVGTTLITVPANATTVPVNVPTTEDAASEPTETFFVNLSGPSANATIADPQGVATVNDDDAVAPPGRPLSINDVTVAEGGLATFTISAPGEGPDVTLTVSTSNGSASAPGDYTSKSQQVTIPHRDATAQFTVQTVQDTADEPDETFFVNLSGQTAGTLTDPQGQGTIVDDDQPAPTTRSITVNDVSVTEGGLASFTISATNPGAQATVNVATSNGSAAAPGDYTALGSTQVTIPSNATTVPVNVQTVQDTADEPDETFFLNLSGPSANAVIADPQGVSTILDDDVAPVTRSISVNDITVSEGGVATFTITATNPGAEATVNVATANGTALAGSDYTALSQFVTIPASATTVTVTVTTLSDMTAEPNETFFLNLSGPSANATIADAQGIATIQNVGGGGR